jgi:AbrB family looped-hinge helix DNA binding protein
MQAKIDSVGRILLPKPLRDALGLKAGTAVDISVYGRGLQLIPESRAARIAKRGGRLVAVSSTKVSDGDVFDLIDDDRRR